MHTKWIEVNDRLPSACTEVFVKRWKKGKVNPRKVLVTEVYFISTHPRECVLEDEIVAWMRIPEYTAELGE
jgi:hypothetical protein